MNNIDISIIIPAYMEEENLRILLPRLQSECLSQKYSSEILIIDTINSLDNTKELCTLNNVTYINRENGNTYGDAIRTGIKYSKGKQVLFMDADGSHSPEFIKTMYQNLFDNDVVIASRYIDGGRSDNSKILIFMSWCVNTTYAVLFNLKCKDVSNSFKLYNGDEIRKLSLKCNNFDIVEEILIKLKRNNKKLKIKEIPYTFKERMFGHTKRNLISFMFSYLYSIIRLKFFV